MEKNMVSDQLYNTCLTVTEPTNGVDVGVYHAYVLATHATLDAAKAFAQKAIGSLGYDKIEFETFEERTELGEAFTHPSGVQVYAKTPKGEAFVVSIDTIENNENLPSGADGAMVLPYGTDHLHYVLQTTTDYRNSNPFTSNIEGIYVKRADAIEAARNCLISEPLSREDYVQYDEREKVRLPEDWPFGEEVFVHAVAQTGENHLIAVTTPPSAYIKHGKKGHTNGVKGESK